MQAFGNKARLSYDYTLRNVPQTARSAEAHLQRTRGPQQTVRHTYLDLAEAKSLTNVKRCCRDQACARGSAIGCAATICKHDASQLKGAAKEALQLDQGNVR